MERQKNPQNCLFDFASCSLSLLIFQIAFLMWMRWHVGSKKKRFSTMDSNLLTP